MGYPVLEIYRQESDCFENCAQDDEDLKSDPEPGGMEVDERFETSHNSFAREQFEESSPMDVDMEDCSNLMANLHVEVISMDE
ncbi:hypothetical protein PM082_016797 [Marasmius tenuissimus]|nr:hypothetical protein PM082_016797 [Marasmius tenuissimus]